MEEPMKRLCLVLVVSAAIVSAEQIAIRGAVVVDGTGAPAAVRTVILNGSTIQAVSAPDSPVPDGARVIDAQGMTLTPGLIDVHTHLLASAGSVHADWGKNLKAYLLSGVTTVVDLSTYPEQFEPMRRLLQSGMPGPRVLMAARFSTRGGHGAEAGRGDFHTQLVLTPEEARAAVRRVVPYKPDVLKVFTDGWRYGSAPDMTSMEDEALAALVDEAHKSGVRVLTHTVTLEKAKIAARAGVDLIIHGISNAPLDDEALELMRSKGTGYAQTMAVYEPRGGRDLSSPLLPLVLEPALKSEFKPGVATANAARNLRWKNLMENARRFRDAGLKQSLGTDAGMGGTFHGWSTVHELDLMVGAGLTPVEAITAGTGTAPKSLGIDSQTGTITEGKRADLVLVEGNAAEEIANMHKVRRVFVGGSEADLGRLAAQVASAELTPIGPVRAVELLDDFEGGERSRIDTRWINNTDSGHDHSEMRYQRTKRSATDHVLTVLCKAAEKRSPLCSMVLPLSKGSVLPVDASGFSGVEFEARGDGAYMLQVPTRSIRDRNYFRAPFAATPEWKRVRIPFSGIGPDLLNLEFQITPNTGESAWLELDNIRFYR